MPLSPEKLDRLITDALSEGKRSLQELGRLCQTDARDVLKRLHVLGGMGSVSCDKIGDSMVWSMTTKGLRNEPKPIILGDSRPVTDAQIVTTAVVDTCVAQESPEIDLPATVDPVVDKKKRRSRKPIIVRAAFVVPQLSVFELNEGEAFIQCCLPSDDTGGDAIKVPFADVPALIAALLALTGAAA